MSSVFEEILKGVTAEDKAVIDRHPELASAVAKLEKDLAGVKLKSVRKRFREGAFARGVDRDSIARCADLGLELDDFMGIGLAAMQGIAPELGL